MIEYGLLFGLGFVTAILAALLLAPAIHRRIVKFTEERILATMPVSRQELRAQKDMVRAEMATQVARTGHDLKTERGRAAQLSIENDQLIQHGSRLYSENSDLRASMDEMSVAAGELRSVLRQEEDRVTSLRETLAEFQRDNRLKEGRIGELLSRIQRLTQDIDNLKIDIATRDTEAEGLRARINALRDERETLRSDLKLSTQRAKDAELRLAREENKSTRLESRLNAEISGSVDKDTVIERRITEIARLKERLKAANAEARETARSTRAAPKPAVVSKLKAGSADDPVKAEDVPTLGGAVLLSPSTKTKDVLTPPVALAETAPAPAPSRMIDPARAAELSDTARSQVNAISDTLLNLQDDGSDDALRTEIADIAAKMVAVTAQREGMGSPMRSMISGKAQKPGGGRISLSERASKLLLQE